MVRGQAYAALVREAERVGWPEAYRNDLLVHDRNACEKIDEGESFGWALRDAGTHVFRHGRHDDVGISHVYLDATLRYSRNARCYLWSAPHGALFECATQGLLVQCLNFARDPERLREFVDAGLVCACGERSNLRRCD